MSKMIYPLIVCPTHTQTRTHCMHATYAPVAQQSETTLGRPENEKKASPHTRNTRTVCVAHASHKTPVTERRGRRRRRPAANKNGAGKNPITNTCMSFVGCAQTPSPPVAARRRRRTATRRLNEIHIWSGPSCV